MFALVRAMVSDAWEQLACNAEAPLQAVQQKLAETDRKIATLIERVIEASRPSVIAAFEGRIASLEREKLMRAEKAEAEAKPYRSFKEMFELSIRFLAILQKIWESDVLTHKRTLLKLAFVDKLVYCRNQGLRSPKTTCIFNMLEGIRGNESQMAERESV